MSEQLSIENLSVSYGKRRVIHQLSVPCMRAGEVTACSAQRQRQVHPVARAGRPAGRRWPGPPAGPPAQPPARRGGLPAANAAASVHLTVFESLMVAGQATAAGLFRRHDDQQVFALLQSLASTTWRCTSSTSSPAANASWWASPRR
ncbi:Uncharacterised protein [Chromobacterium violaceum]|uniref:Uncharacterized protein n=1 Tax=Chromobacterium violaceum TaxID=536 RepID=A0A3S4IYZ2_CHRVL|nr:Uncharacterised protein [Chromobacterium violaceum]